MVDKLPPSANCCVMTEYILKLKREKLERMTEEYNAAVEQFSREQRTAVPTTQTDEMPPAVLAAEKALNSNSSFLMRSRTEPLLDAMRSLRSKQNAVADGAWNKVPADVEIYDKLKAVLKRWNELLLALQARAEALEKAAADKIQNRERLAAWHQERKENAEATKQCAIDRARCLASRKETL